MTFKYNPGHRTWYKWAKLIEYYQHAKFDTYRVYSVRENRKVNVFATIRTLARQSQNKTKDSPINNLKGVKKARCKSNKWEVGGERE